MKNWRSAILTNNPTIRQAMQAIDQSSLQIALVVDGNDHLLGTVTDGDIRRGLLRGLDLDSPAAQVMNVKPKVARQGMSRAEFIELLRRYELHHLPLVDETGRLVGLESDVELYEGAEKDNWVVLMAGGLGQRLRPLTEDMPKPLLPVGDRPLLEIIINRFTAQGFRKFFISVNYRADLVEAHFGDGAKFGAEIRYLREDQPLGTGGAVGLLPERPSLPFVVMNGDLLTTINFESLVDFHQQHEADLTLCVRRYSHQIPYGVAEIQGGEVMSIVEKPNHECFISGGIYVLSPAVFDRLQPQRRVDMPDLMRELIAEKRRVTAFPVTEYWIDIGRIEDLERARQEIDLVG
ncbi:nucleotidyltransferase family protein [Dongia sp.]|uniref:nucleotidyltransferase family protein n=1 Tax=Dongia sp. TaxID=1977262 RepID=UPI00375277D2